MTEFMVVPPIQWAYIQWVGNIVGAVAHYGSQRKAGKAFGVSPTTVRRWLAKERNGV